MDPKTLGWTQIIGGALALLTSWQIGYVGMMGMMYGGYNMMDMMAQPGLAISILSILFIIVGVHHVTEKHKRH
jgi:uncharacterized membrane protein